jgi:alkaline phosphatase
VILFIADGAGAAYWSAARLASSTLAVDRFPVGGLVDTRSSDSRVTDSAASATAYATGVRTYNGAIGMGPDTMPVRTVLEVAERKGLATGLVATSTLTHATPAAFAAHRPDRGLYYDIAVDIAGQGVDVLLGGGKRFFDPATRPDSQNLLRGLTARAAYVETPEQFYALNPDTVRALVGLFADNNPGPATNRKPALAELTDAALTVLEKNRRGFFLMVEGSQIDWRGHENAPLTDVIAEVLDLDFAVGRGLAFQQRRPNTLILVVADHETGGLALHSDAMGVFRAHYTTEGHTAEMVPLFGAGPGASAFGGIRDIDEVGRLLLELVAAGGAKGPPARASTGAGMPWTSSSPSPPR